MVSLIRRRPPELAEAISSMSKWRDFYEIPDRDELILRHAQDDGGMTEREIAARVAGP